MNRINRRGMENRFEYLRIDGRGSLPEPWSGYPVLKEYETVIVYREGRDFLHALIGVQDGYWVAGAAIWMAGGGSGFLPGRKWGQFASRNNALLWSLGYMLTDRNVTGAARDAVLKRIESIRQLSLF